MITVETYDPARAPWCNACGAGVSPHRARFYVLATRGHYAVSQTVCATALSGAVARLAAWELSDKAQS